MRQESSLRKSYSIDRARRWREAQAPLNRCITDTAKGLAVGTHLLAPEGNRGKNVTPV